MIILQEENVVHGVPATVSPIDYSTGIFMYERLVENIHKGALFVNEVTGEQITYESFLQYSCRLADSLIKYGIHSKNVISVCSENCIEYFIPVIAGLFAGIPVCLTNSLYTECELNSAFDLIKPTIVFCSVKNLDKMMDMKKNCPEIKEIIVINSDAPISGASNLKQFIGKHSRCVDIYNYKPVAVDVENHIAFILFSSGTTGLPKGVMLTHRNINYKNATFREPWLTVEKQSQYVLGLLPNFYAFGLHVIINSIILGCTIIILEKFDFELHLKYIEKYKITTLGLPPPVLQLYAKSPLMKQYDLSHVEYVLVGGAPLDEALRQVILQEVGIKSICQGYGMTELTLPATMVPVGLNRPGTCGKLIPYLTATVKDLKTGRNLGPNENGELCFKGDLVMKGYYKNEVATKETFTEDGYLRTGDLGHYDEEGFFYIDDRLKELIKYKGYQVAPAELEGVLLSNPKIKKAAVIGIPDEDAGELPMAFVVRQTDANITEQEVIDHVKKFVAPAKYLRGGVVFVEDIPVSPAGKILRRELKLRLQSRKIN